MPAARRTAAHQARLTVVVARQLHPPSSCLMAASDVTGSVQPPRQQSLPATPAPVTPAQASPLVTQDLSRSVRLSCRAARFSPNRSGEPEAVSGRLALAAAGVAAWFSARAAWFSPDRLDEPETASGRLALAAVGGAAGSGSPLV